MATAFTTKIRQWIDRTFPVGPAGIALFPVPSPSHALKPNVYKGSDILFPLYSVVENGMVTPGAALNVNIQGAILRDGNGNLIEIQPATNALTFVAPASGKQTLYLVYYDTVGAAYATVAGATANVGSGVLPTVPAGGIPLAQVDMRNGDTSPAAARISNTVRYIY